MAKQWTRNYDNLFSAVFGCHEIKNSGSSNPTFNAPMVKRPNGSHYPIVMENSLGRILNSFNISVPAPKSYLTITNNSITMNSTSTIEGTTFIRLGTGVTPPTYEDYELEAPIISGLNVGTVSGSQTYDEDTHIYTRTYKIPVAYSGANDINVTEFGIYVYTMTESNTYALPVLIYRETLDYPVTLLTNDTIEITFSQSIMQPNYTPYPN